MLRLLNFSKDYGNIPVLNTTDILLDPGVYWIKGANGSGKSTLLKAIAGIIHSEGDIIAHGTSIKQNPVAYRKLITFAEAEPLVPRVPDGHRNDKVVRPRPPCSTGRRETPTGRNGHAELYKRAARHILQRYVKETFYRAVVSRLAANHTAGRTVHNARRLPA